MLRFAKGILLAWSLCFFVAGNVLVAQEQAKLGPLSQYDPGPAYPFGRLNPEAPPETKQFAFMIGECDCVDQIRKPDGSWISFPAKWNASYFLNGFGIQDQYWSPTIYTSNIRIFDRSKGKWMVTFFKMPGYGSGVWQGRKEGDRLIMRQNQTGPGGQPVESRLTFYNISEHGFDWISESVRDGVVTAGWKSSCKKK